MGTKQNNRNLTEDDTQRMIDLINNAFENNQEVKQKDKQKKKSIFKF